MKTKLSILVFLLLAATSITNAQINNPLKVLKDKASQKANNEIDKKADEVVNPDVNNNDQNNNENSGNPQTGNQNTDSNTSGNTTSSNASSSETVSVTAYQNYDFRAGDKIIFEDDFASDADGEFPSHWDLASGQAVVNKITGKPSFLLTDGNYCRVSPRMSNNSYLTDNFSIEYDTYMPNGAYGLIIYMYDNEDHDMSVHTTAGDVTWSFSNTNSLNGSLPSAIRESNYYNKWHHVAMAYKNDQLKVYVDQYRVLTVPHCNFKPARFECAGIGNQDNPIIFKDMKVADGASMNMLDELTTKGKFITHGINFNVNSADLKPESMGVIGDVVKYMKEHGDLKIEIDGHTDSDGGDDANMKLSQARADAVKNAMVKAGIDSARISTKGLGESKPMASNDTPQGKAENRRVEFVKM